MDLQDISGGVDWMDVAHNTDKLPAFVKTVMNIRASQNVGNL